MSDALALWVVYDHPRDYPNHFVLRRHWSWSMVWPNGRRVPARCIDKECWGAEVLGAIHHRLEGMGLTYLPRQAGDDPAILETWL